MLRLFIVSAAHRAADSPARVALCCLTLLSMVPVVIGTFTTSNDHDPTSADLAPAGPSDSVEPALTLEAGVYTGHDAGARCAGAPTYAEAHQHTAVTFCYTVRNAGPVPVTAVAVTATDEAGSMVPLGTYAGPLQPGEATLFVLDATPPPDIADGQADDTYTARASAEATAGDVTVTATAEAVVFPPEEPAEVPAAAMTLIATAAPSVEGGPTCPGADEGITAGQAITYCFTVTNTGTTHLDAIAVADPLIAEAPVLVRADSTPLAPGGSAVFALQATAPGGDTVTTAVASANPVDAAGADLVGVEDPVVTAELLVQAAPEPPPEPLIADAASTGTTSSEAGGAAGSGGAGSGGAGSGGADGPTELAHTGWATWLLGGLGTTLIIAGWYLLNPGAWRPVTLGRGVVDDPFDHPIPADLAQPRPGQGVDHD